jgi:hypothetical protein
MWADSPESIGKPSSSTGASKWAAVLLPLDRVHDFGVAVTSVSA